MSCFVQMRAAHALKRLQGFCAHEPPTPRLWGRRACDLRMTCWRSRTKWSTAPEDRSHLLISNHNNSRGGCGSSREACHPIPSCLRLATRLDFFYHFSNLHCLCNQARVSMCQAASVKDRVGPPGPVSYSIYPCAARLVLGSPSTVCCTYAQSQQAHEGGYCHYYTTTW